MLAAKAADRNKWLKEHCDQELSGTESLVVGLVADPGDPPVFDLGSSASTTLSIVNNGGPTAQADSYSTDEDTSLTVNAAGVMTNDSDNQSAPH